MALASVVQHFTPNYYYLVTMMAMAFLLLHWEQPMVAAAIAEGELSNGPVEIQPPFIQISKSKMKRLLDILNARSRQKTEGLEDASSSMPYPVNKIRDSMVPIGLKSYIRPQRPLSENRDIVGWERLGWGWK
uniref:Uncharacterized protein n=1 Tax=Ditylenchus dipsaci TaxID=166011 RepID=A0A915D2C7_9BILA